MTCKVIIVHGFWYGSWCWSRVVEQLAARGVMSVALDLEGHGLNGRGSSARWDCLFGSAVFAVGLSGVAAVTVAGVMLVEQVRVIGGGEPCVVVAHSQGGTVATAVTELAPYLFAPLVYVAAFAPIVGLPCGAYSSAPENRNELVLRLLRAVPAAVGAVRIDPGDRDAHAAIREILYGDVGEAAAIAAISLLSADGPLGMATEAFAVTADRYGTVPRTYVVCTRDNVIPAPLQRRFIREIGAVSNAPSTVREFVGSHSPFLAQLAALATVIAGFAGASGM
ncbi:alpha/beta fold hydrolase [Streptomyces rimosus]|nr:alpha/beta fold hydrolase [Streptomyces rimosus]